MANVNDEQLNAYLDGELPESEADAVERALANDDALSARLGQLAQVDDLLRGAVDQLELSSQSQGLGPRTAAQPDFAQGSKPAPIAANDNWWRLPLTASVALIVGVFAGGTVLNFGAANEDPLRLASYDSGTELGGFLETAVSGDTLQIDGGNAELQLTFVGPEGKPCREFSVTASQSTTSGVACRGNGPTWNVAIATRTQTTDSADPSGYRTASAGDEAFGAAVGAMMQSDALGPDDERELMENDWTQ